MIRAAADAAIDRWARLRIRFPRPDWSELFPDAKKGIADAISIWQELFPECSRPPAVGEFSGSGAGAPISPADARPAAHRAAGEAPRHGARSLRNARLSNDVDRTALRRRVDLDPQLLRGVSRPRGAVDRAPRRPEPASVRRRDPRHGERRSHRRRGAR